MRLPSVAPVVLCALASAACYGGGYRDLGTPFIGQRVHFDNCLDLAIAQTTDDIAPGTILAYTFGNRCGHDAIIDLSAIRAYGRYSDGMRPLRALDPNHELRPLRLGLWRTETEQIAYAATDEAAPTAICVDASAVEVGSHQAPHWLCFGTWDLGDSLAIPDATATASTTSSTAPTTPPTTLPAAETVSWPVSAGTEPEVLAMPVTAQASIATVGAYLATRIPDQRRLVKALHDYVVRRLHYQSSGPGRERDSQLADDVFARHAGVCEGYARLLTALGTAAGLDIRYIDGTATDAVPGTDKPGAHAWNAVNLDGKWALIDATWDGSDPSSPATTYLMPPPGRFARTHQPYDAAWTLTAPPLGFDDFVRTPWPRADHLGVTP